MSKKQGFLTPKAIANRIKAKGLQKLRWYCQMCQKQCRDENGFKCHTTSESHQRQLLLVADNPGMYIGGFSDEFLKDFMLLLSRQYGTRRVNANEVYQNYIKDRNHFHMNATRWETLTGFVTWLGRKGLCEVEHTEKGWFMKYIDRSPEALARQAAAAKKDKMEKDDEERTQKMIEQQIARALAAKGEEDGDPAIKYTELQRKNEDEKITFSLKTGGSGSSSSTTGSSVETGVTSSRELTQADPESQNVGSESFETVESESRGDGEQTTPSSTPSSHLPGSSGNKDVKGGFGRSTGPAVNLQVLPNALKSSRGASSSARSSHKESTAAGKKRKLTTLEEIRLMEEQQKEKKNRRDNWIAEGIIVKVIHKKLGERFYKKKGVITEVRDQYTAVVEMLETGNKIKIDQTHLETVIPAIGRSVLVVNGAYRGHKAILETLDTSNFCATIRIDQGPVRGRLVDRVPYEDISKLCVTQ